MAADFGFARRRFSKRTPLMKGMWSYHLSRFERAPVEDEVITVLPSRKKLPSLFGNLYNPVAELRRHKEQQEIFRKEMEAEQRRREEEQRAREEAEKLEKEAELRQREQLWERARGEAEKWEAEQHRLQEEKEIAREEVVFGADFLMAELQEDLKNICTLLEEQMFDLPLHVNLTRLYVREDYNLMAKQRTKEEEKERELRELGELKALKTYLREQFDRQNTSVGQRKSVGRMDDDEGFIKTFPPVISQQQNNFEPIQEINISNKDSGTGVKAQRWPWEGMDSNSRKTDARNIFITTAAQGMEEVFPTSSTFSWKNRGQKQGNGEDNEKKQTLVLLTTGTVSRSPMGHETGRVDIYAGDKNLLNAGFRQEHGIRDIIAMHQTSVPSDAANDSDLKFLVRMRPYGEGKDSWEHCTTQDGDVGLPEEQPLYISQILRGSSTFPASATWVLETPDKCTPSSTLEAVLEIKLVTGHSMVPSQRSNVTSGNPVAQLSIQVQGKELQDAVTDLERPDSQQCGTTLEEKYQTELMEK